jgi:signal transduction histidine kinase/putative methionine-R-sulfoxide reductase with GAF domain
MPGIDDDVLSALSAPVTAEGKLLGVLTVLNREVDAFSVEHVELIQAICQEVGLALSNAQRYQQVQRRLTEIMLIQSLTQAFSQRLEVKILLNEIVTQLVEKLGYTHLAVFLIQSDYLVLKASHGLQITARAFPLASSIARRITHNGEITFVPDVSAVSDYIAWCDTPICSEISVPIFQDNELIGVILVGSQQSNQLSTQDRDLLQVLAGQITVALENAILYEKVHNHAAELERVVEQRTAALTGLYQLSQEIGSSLSFDELIRLLLRHLKDAIPCEMIAGCLGLENNQSVKIQTARHADPGLLPQVLDGWTKLRLQYGQTAADLDEVHSEIIQDANGLEELPVLQSISSWIWTPILIDESRGDHADDRSHRLRLIGALAVGSQSADAFGPAQERLLSTFANQASAAAQRLLMLLTAQQKQLRSLVEHLPIGVLLLDSDFHILLANPEGREILDALKIAPPDNILTQLGPLSMQELLERQSKQPPIEITTLPPIQRSLAVQLAPAGAPAGDERNQWVLTLNDITQEREYQLRAQIQERLATVGQLAAGIAHDFNNIMAAILVYTDLLLYDPTTTPGNRDKLGIIQQQIQRASSLIRQILDFSRRSVMDQSRLDLLPLIKEFDKMLARVLPETIQVQLSFEPDAYWVNGDPARLQQVFMNLALNARDAMPDGGTLRFELNKLQLKSGSTRPIPEMPDGKWVRIQVSDTGTGILPEYREHIFEPFFTTKPVSQGTGLGLAQVYGIVRQHDGYIDVDSQPGLGATFKIYLPALEKLEEWANEPEQPKQLSGQGQMIMVVEDDTSTRQALQTLLEVIGYRTLVAANGVEALKLFEQSEQTIHLVISDIVMPQMGGLELHQELKQRNPEIKMLLITGHPLSDLNQTLLEKGQIDWLQKPFTLQGLNLALQNLLQS